MKVELLQPDTLTIEIVQDVVSLVDEVPPPRQEVENWTPLEQAMVYDWAMREHLAAAGNRVQRRAKPYVLARGQAVTPSEEVEGLSQENVDLNGWLNATKSALDSVTQERDELTARVAALESERDIMQGIIEDLETKLGDEPEESVH